jgi:hypothetical protein
LTAPTLVSVRPQVSGTWVLSVAGAIVAAFAIIAITLPRSTTFGDSVQWSDRLSMFGLGLLVAAIVATPAWPRVRADAEGVRTRGFVGGYRLVPWSLVHAVEFPLRSRWAVLVLADEETVSLYAIQRADGERSIEAMRGLRALLAASRAE